VIRERSVGITHGMRHKTQADKNLEKRV
jgi:hypothetical protein